MLANAQSEACRFYHEYIGTEHLLLGLLKHARGLAIQVFAAHKVDPRKIRIEIEKYIQPGPEALIMPKLPNTPRTVKVIEFAEAESQKTNTPYVGTGQFLIGLLSVAEGVAAEVLRSVGITLERVRDVLPIVAEKFGAELILPAGFSLDLSRVFGRAVYDLLHRSGISDEQIRKLASAAKNEKTARTVATLLACAESSRHGPHEDVALSEQLALLLAEPLCALSDAGEPRKVLEGLRTSALSEPYAEAIRKIIA